MIQTMRVRVRVARASAAVAAACALLAAGAPAGADAAGPAPARFEVGAAVRSIDPLPGVPVYAGGFSLSPPITRVRDPLQVRAFYVSNGTHAVAIAVVDSQAYFAAYQEGPGYGITSARDDAARAITALGGAAVGRQDIIIQGTHSHAAPTLEGLWGPVPPRYLKYVHDQAVAALAAAAAAAQPAVLQWAKIAAPDIVGLNIDQDSYEGWEDDTQLSVLRALDPRTHATIATFASVPTHGAHICGQCEKLLSADYFGAVRTQLDAELGGISIVGPATLGRQESPLETTGDANMEFISGTIANLVVQALGRARYVTDATIRGSESLMQTPATNAAIVALVYAWKLPESAKAAEAQLTGIYPADRSTDPPYMTGNVIGTYLTALRIGHLAFLSMPGEPFPAVRFAIARAVPGADLVVALSKGQDDLGYFYPAFVEPFTEVYGSDHLLFNVAPQIGDQVIHDQAHNLGKLGFDAHTPLEQPTTNDYLQKLRPGLQALASPPTGDVRPGGTFTTRLQAVYSPASLFDYPLAGKVHWDFGDGTTADTGWLQAGQDYGQTGQGNHGDPVVQHSFAPGTYTVRTSAVDTHGNRAEWTTTVRVHPALRAVVRRRADGAGRYTFTGRARGGEGHVLAWHWRFSDGATAEGRRVAHRFAPDTPPAATLTVVDATGTTATARD